MTDRLKQIRKALLESGASIARSIDCTRAVWSMHESREQVQAEHWLPPRLARNLVRYARSKGMPLTYEHIYEGAPLPVMTLAVVKTLRKPAARAKAVPVTQTPPPVETPVQPRPRRRIIASAVA